jgi:LacI family transcriptional regulator
MKYTLQDIAKLANISEAAVSLALNDKKGVSEETRSKVKELASKYNYKPNAFARGLVERKSRTIGLVVPDTENPYYGKIVKCVDSYIREYGYHLIIAISNEDYMTEAEIIDEFISKQVEGIIIVPTNKPNSNISYYETISQQHLPCVFISSFYNGTDLPFIMVDLKEGMYSLVKYLLNLGHRHIYFICGNYQSVATDFRLEGYKAAFEELKVAFDNSYIIECPMVTFEQAYQSTIKLVNNVDNIDAIVTANDYMALGVLNALHDKNIKVPEDISLAGFDNVVFSSIASIPITTVSQDIPRMVNTGVDTLLDIIKNNNRGSIHSVFIKPELIIRESTKEKRLIL